MSRLFLLAIRSSAPAFVFFCALGLAASAPPPAGKGACQGEAREKYRAALAECRKMKYIPDRRSCRERADRADDRARAKCRKMRD